MSEVDGSGRDYPAPAGEAGQETLETVLDSAIEIGRRGDHARAYDLFLDALEHSECRANQERRDRVLCNLCSVALELGRSGDHIGELRRIVLRARSAETAFLSAYSMARHHDLQHDNSRARFYLGIATDRAVRFGREDWIAWCHNLRGNLNVVESRFEEASRDFECALKMLQPAQSLERAVAMEAAGYCQIIQGAHREGFRLLYQSLRSLISQGATQLEAIPRLSLCYAYLEVGKLRAALRQGLRALEIAEASGVEMNIKHAYFLLGDTYSQMGYEDEALTYFRRLQKRYYPQAVHVPELLLAIDVRSFVNLKG